MICGTGWKCLTLAQWSAMERLLIGRDLLKVGLEHPVRVRGVEPVRTGQEDLTVLLHGFSNHLGLVPADRASFDGQLEDQTVSPSRSVTPMPGSPL